MKDTKLMLHKFSSVLSHYKPNNMRRRSLKKIWSLITLAIAALFLVENALFFIPSRSTSEEHPGHSHKEFDQSDRSSKGDNKMNQMQPKIFTTDHDIVYTEHFLPVQNPKPIVKKKQNHFKVGQPSPRKGTDLISKWMVVMAHDGCDVTHFTKIPEWKVVVIGKPPRSCKAPVCTYIDAAKEKSLKYDLTKLLPASSEGRKMIGYLYAISKGAKVIYDVECDVFPKSHKLGFLFTGNTSGLAFTGGPIFNPYNHFGFPMLFPRGFPETSLNTAVQSRYRIVDTEVPAIQQGQVNFALGKKDVSYLKLDKDVNITFDRSSPPVYLSANRFGPINSLNTVFLYKAFWALFLPTNFKGDGDIVRGYIAQRLLDEIGGCAGFLSPTAYSITPRSSKNKFVLPKQTTSKFTETLIGSLTKWKCVPKMSFFGCARSLINHLVMVNFLTKTDNKLFDVWISDLRKVGYREAVRRNKVDGDVRPTRWNPEVMYKSHKVIPSEIFLGKDQSQLNIYEHVFKKLHNICPRQKQTLAEWINPPITDIMLVVIFNYEFLFKNLPYMEFSHRMYFRHILYCGPSFEGFDKVLRETNMHHLIYVNGVDKDTWFFTYQCIVHAANMKLNVKGYLYIGDDILLNTWNIINLPRDRFWMPMPMTYIERNQTKQHWWYYWNKPVGKKAANLVIDEIQDLAQKNPKDSMVSNFLNMYNKNVKLSRVVHRSIDVFYAPAVYNDEIVRFGRIFRNHSTLLGLTVPMLHAGLIDLKHVVRLKGKSLWRESRSNNIEAFKEDQHYLHPFKAGKDLASKTGRDFFCGTFLPLSNKKLQEAKKNVQGQHKQIRKNK